ncbi:MAG: KpsF/GutQ family sugar-phosphate isomerase [Planctomycetota bacterium]
MANDRTPTIEAKHRETSSACSIASRVMRAEADAVVHAASLLGPSFEAAVELIARKRGSVIVSGVGKSGLVGAKISATLSSTGTPSHFMHATEAVHGDLGRIRDGDTVLLLSYSGSTDEVINLAELLRQDDIPIISITRGAETQLAKLSDAALVTGDVTEACPNNLAPSASTTAMIALGDALSLAVAEANSFSAEDFHRAHPGGLLGRQMMSVNDVLRFRVGVDIEVVAESETVLSAVRIATAHGRRAGATMLVNEAGELSGIFTDADLRRLLVKDPQSALDRPIREVMTASPKRLASSARVRDAVQLVRESRVDEIPVVDASGCPIGLLDVQDLIALKVIES